MSSRLSKLLFIPLLISAALGGCSPGIGPNLDGAIEANGVPFQGGNPILAQARTALGFFIDGLEAIVAGTATGLCGTPQPGVVAESVRAVLQGLSDTQRELCHASLQELAPEWLMKLRQSPPQIELRVGPLLADSESGGRVHVVAKTLPSWGSPIYLDVDKGSALSLTELATLMGHETGHQRSGAPDRAMKSGFRDVGHWLDVLSAAVTAVGFPNGSPDRSLALARLSDGGVAVLGLTATGGAWYRLFSAAGNPAGPWQKLVNDEGVRQVLAVHDGSGQAVVVRRDGLGGLHYLNVQAGNQPFTGAWTALPAKQLLQLAGATLADGRLALAGIDDSQEKTVHVLVEDSPGSRTWGAGWRATGLRQVSFVNVERMGDDNLWILGLSGPAELNKGNYLFAKSADLADAARLSWSALPGEDVKATQDPVYDPRESGPSLIALGGAGPQFIVGLINHRLTELWDGEAEYNAATSPPGKLPPNGWKHLVPAGVWSAAALKAADGGIWLAAAVADGRIMLGKSAANAPNDFRNRWRQIGYNLAVETAMRAKATGSITWHFCRSDPFLQKFDDTAGMYSDQPFYEADRQRFIGHIHRTNRFQCGNPSGTATSWIFKTDRERVRGNYRALGAPPGTRCVVSVARCSKRVYLPGSYVQPAAIDALTECFGRALNIWNACGGSNMDAVACEFMAGRYRHGISINAEQ